MGQLWGRRGNRTAATEDRGVPQTLFTPAHISRCFPQSNSATIGDSNFSWISALPDVTWGRSRRRRRTSSGVCRDSLARWPLGRIGHQDATEAAWSKPLGQPTIATGIRKCAARPNSPPAQQAPPTWPHSAHVGRVAGPARSWQRGPPVADGRDTGERGRRARKPPNLGLASVSWDFFSALLQRGAECDVILEIVPPERDGLRVLDAIEESRVAWDRAE